MNYEVEVVGAGELPEGVDRVIVERTGGRAPILLLAPAAARTWLLMQRWEQSRPEADDVCHLRAV